ncbi:hypothetical protein SD71_01360 [Cohnella kolymensis]|uniref:DZANK-type domain-containing protein n=1 Tax=Cohnella kolymensis TaxID=1590652 RepID=A0ABR5A9I7_9BACL|nr:hypothetical protein [Cohnella kolymensis]KIL37353.1 hypothetical protein SD71_01360 [Cohnella kolymensis]
MASDNKEKPGNCIRCGYSYKKGSQYCAECGAPVVNKCLDEGDLLRDPCGCVNGEDAAFCSQCGCATAFNRAGLVTSPYPENKVLQTDEMGEMKWFYHPFFSG